MVLFFTIFNIIYIESYTVLNIAYFIVFRKRNVMYIYKNAVNIKRDMHKNKKFRKIEKKKKKINSLFT